MTEKRPSSLRARPIALARAAVLLATFGLAPLACGGLTDRELLPPEGQVLVYVNTDASLPPGPGESEGDEQPALFHRIVIDLFPPGETTPCDGCSREFAVTRREVLAGKASFGFVPKAGAGAGYRARFRLYRTAGPGAQFPRPRSTIELVALLPTAPAQGITHATAVLRTDDVGVPRGSLDQPEELEPGPAKPGLAGTWATSLPRECPFAVDETEACVPGGAYWVGNPVRDADSERLVKVAPFAIGLTEVTVAQYRAANIAKRDVPANPIPTDDFNAFCTYTPKAGPTDDHPVNCLDAAYAEKFCAASGKRLPTETEFEIVAGALRGLRFPWGDDYPECTFATWGRADDVNLPPTLRACASAGVGSAKVGSGTRDRIAVGGKEVVDMAGNVGEWTQDEFAEWGTKCWKATGIGENPVCRVGENKAPRSVRGGEWGSIPFSLVSTIRIGVPPGERSTRTGFRCAR